MSSSRTLMYDVAGLVIHRKQINVDEVAEAFPSHTREQIRRALNNASNRGLIKCLHGGRAAAYSAQARPHGGRLTQRS